MLPALVVSQAVGYSTAPNAWDDNVDCGGWPAYENITKILSVSIWVGKNVINGIETTYRTKNSGDKKSMRGETTGDRKTVTVGDDEFFVGIFGSQENDSDQPTLRRLGFLIYKESNGTLTPYGPFPEYSASNVKGFMSLGSMVAFAGTTGNNRRLETLSVYTLQSGSGSFGDNSA